MNQYLLTGKIFSMHGLKGYLKVYPLCDSPDDLLELEKVFLDEKGKKRLEIEKGHIRKNIVYLKFKDIDDANIAQKYIGKSIYLDKNDIVLEEGCYFVEDLLGACVIDEKSGENYGRIIEISNNGSHDIYHIERNSGKVNFFPAVVEFIISTDIENKVIKIKTIPGMFEK
ncbi:MAG: 16S rRNA processing protein RimM [Ruminococcaceae bacterium]|nr:16S rRNA processing protein RimM [Oscillospiraceae bacterium]